MKKILSILLCGIIALSLSACGEFEEVTSEPVTSETVSDTSSQEKVEIKIPEIKSEDDVMPSYVDISLYDEENYSDIYLGKNFKFKVTYAGSAIKLPWTYKDMVEDGWKLIASDEYNENSQIMAGKSITVEFDNEYGKKITAVFHNGTKSSLSLKECPIVKFVIKENGLNVPESAYGQFWVNGVSNLSAITDLIELLGSPSHFYRISENKYYLDWFISASDRRSGITVYVDTAEDHIDAIEFSLY